MEQPGFEWSVERQNAQVSISHLPHSMTDFPYKTDTFFFSSSIDCMLRVWAFLSLFDVAIIERLVLPAEAVLKHVGGQVLGEVKGFAPRLF